MVYTVCVAEAAEVDKMEINAANAVAMKTESVFESITLMVDGTVRNVRKWTTNAKRTDDLFFMYVRLSNG